MKNIKKSNGIKYFVWIAEVCDFLGCELKFGKEISKNKIWMDYYSNGLLPEEAVLEYQKTKGDLP